MTESKQKAQQLVSRYWSAKVETPHVRESVISKELAIKCAITCVEEIIKSSPHSPSKPLELMPHLKACIYWQEVLTHLKEML